MLCLPGLTPVAKLDHAVGDSEGCVEPSLAKTPSSASAFRFGSLPSSMYLRDSVGSMPSKPITNTRCLARRSGLPPSGPLRQPKGETARAAAAASRASLTRNGRKRVGSIESTCLD